ncbi:hypothetical protein O3P69_010016 [Scylla paramamosain]|uniref:Importin subunit alpha n=1 Tax=Scylla paramamosain TaxID=85552 RepID=A0AAW0SNR5_SCYPA
MDHGPMVSSGIGHRARRRLSRGSPEPLLPQRRPFDSPSSRSMDLASIRARRARLEALTASIKLPPLVPSEALPPSSASARGSPLSRGGMLPDSPLRRITWEERPLTGMGSPEPRLPPTLPRMATPHHPLPSIGHSREALSDFLPETPEEEEDEVKEQEEEEEWKVSVKCPRLACASPQSGAPSAFPSPATFQSSTAFPFPTILPSPATLLPSPTPPPPPPLHHHNHNTFPPHPSSPPTSPTNPITPTSPIKPSPPTQEVPPSTREASSTQTSTPPPASPTKATPSTETPSLNKESPPTSPTKDNPPTQISAYPVVSVQELPQRALASPHPPNSAPELRAAAHTGPYPVVSVQEHPSLTPTTPRPPASAPELSRAAQISSRSSASAPEFLAGAHASSYAVVTVQELPPSTQSSPRPTASAPELSPPIKSPSPSTHSASFASHDLPEPPVQVVSLSAIPVAEDSDAGTAHHSITVTSAKGGKPRDPKEFVSLVAKMSSNNTATRTAATIRVRQLLSSSHNAPIDEMLRLDVLTPALANLQENNPALQYETVWIITNIVSGTTQQTQAVADKGFVPVLVELVASGQPWVKEQAAWALGNMAADSSHLRNQIVQAGALRPLAELTKPEAKVSSLHKVVWALSNIFKLRNLRASPDDISFVLEVFRDHLLTHRDEEVVADALWTLTYLTDAGSNKAIQLVVEAGLLPILVGNLSSRSRQVVYPSIRALGTVVSGTDSQTEAALDAGMLAPLHTILKESREARRTKEATWALSNITAGTVEQIQKVVDEGFLHTLVHLIQEGATEVAREAVWAVSNLVAGGSAGQVAALVKAGGVRTLLDTLKPPAPHRLDLITVDTLLTILEKTGGGVAVQQMAEAGGVLVMSEKLGHEDEEVVERAREILETYFPDDSITEDEDEEEED